MENLVGRKLIALQSYPTLGLTKGKEYEIINQRYDRLYFVTDLGSQEFTSLINSNLFKLVEEPQFKQGDKVLYTDDLVNWEDGVFLVKHNESYIVESDEMLLYAIEIKPYEDEIKVGDWVFLNDEIGVCKITDKHDLKEVNNKFTLVKNPQLIELLNEEL